MMLHKQLGLVFLVACFMLTGATEAHAVTASLSTSASSVTAGQSVTLSWSSSGASSCTGTGFSTNNTTSGSVSVTPSATATYGLSCTGAYTDCSPQTASYIPSCNRRAEPLDISCQEGQRAQITQMYICDVGPNNNEFRETAQCVACAGGGSASDSETVTVTSPTYPDLTATNQSPAHASSHTAGTSISFSAGVSNIGTGPSTSFPTLFQFCTSGCTGYSQLVSAQSKTLTAGGSSSISASHIFPSANTYYYRSCADYTTSWIGTQSESNESNNCSAWTQISVATPAISASCSVSPTSATTGQSVTWSASVSGGTGSYTYSWSGTNSLSGSSASVAKTYTTTGVKTASVTITSGSLSSTIPCSNSVSVSVPPSTSDWVNMGCAAEQTYNPVCNPTAEPRDIACSTGEMLQGRDVYGWPCEPPDNDYRQERRCVVDASCSVPPAQPDLTAGSITPTSATTGVATTLSSSISNAGTASSGTSFTNAFYLATGAGGTGTVTLIGTSASSALSAGASLATTRSHTFTTSGTWYVRACTDNNGSWIGTITESNEGNNCGAWTAIVVSASDLTTGNITPTSASVNQAVTLSASVSNGGSASTGTGFSVLFQRATSSGGANATDIGTYSRTTALTGGQSFSATRSYSFPSATTWYVRACADKGSSSDLGLISESDEDNNCGNWTAISVSAPASPSVSCTPSPTSLSGAPGQVTYTATVANGSGSYTYTWTPSAVSTTCNPNSGNQKTCTLQVDGTHAMSVVANGTGNPSANCSPNVYVAPSCVVSDVSIQATPDRVEQDESTTITWGSTFTGPCSCSVSGPGLSSSNTTGSQSVQITGQSTFSISCNGVTDDVIVNVIPAFEEF